MVDSDKFLKLSPLQNLSDLRQREVISVGIGQAKY